MQPLMQTQPPETGPPGQAPEGAGSSSVAVEALPKGLIDLFEVHQARILRAAFRVTGNLADAEDVLQTIFLRLLKRDEPARLGEGAGSYLHRAAVNAGLDLLRARGRSKVVPIDGAGEAERIESDRTTRADRRLQSLELRDELRRAVSGLSPRAAEIFALRYFEDLGNSEIAEMLGTSRSSIGVTLHRARAQVKEAMADMAGEAS